MGKVDDYLNMNKNQYCTQINKDIQQIKSKGKLGYFINHLNESNYACQLKNGDLFDEPESESGFDFLSETKRYKEKLEEQQLSRNEKANKNLAQLEEDIKNLNKKRRGKADNLNQIITEFNKKIKKLREDNKLIYYGIIDIAESVNKQVLILEEGIKTNYEDNLSNVEDLINGINFFEATVDEDNTLEKYNEIPNCMVKFKNQLQVLSDTKTSQKKN